MLVKCKECGKEYDLGFFDKLDKYQCSECGGELRLPTFKENSDMVKNKQKTKDKSKKSHLGFKIIVIGVIGLISFAWLFLFFPIGIIGFIFFFGLLYDEMRTKTRKDIMQCPACSRDVSKDAGVCPRCGHPLN